MPDRRTERHEQTREEILTAAWGLARGQGVTGWTLREVAQAVGMRAPSLYVYFASKDAIYDAMFAQGYRELATRLAAMPELDDPVDRLRAGARMFLDFVVEDIARHQLLFLPVVPGFEPSSGSYAVAEQVLEELRSVLLEAGIDGQSSLDLYTALISGLATQQVSNEPGGTRWIGLVDQALDMYLASELPASDARHR